MFGIEKLTELTLTHISQIDSLELAATLKSVTELLIKLMIEQNRVYTALTKLEQRIADEKTSDREFTMSIIKLLQSTKPNEMVKLSKPFDPFEELPVGHPSGFTKEELGIVYQSKAEGETA